MPISFELTENTIAARDFYRTMASEQMRPVSRRYDDHRQFHRLGGLALGPWLQDRYRAK